MIKSELPSSDHYIINNGSVIFTVQGVNYFLPYFKKTGIDINYISTVNDLLIAKRLIRPLLIADMKKDLYKKTLTIERRWLLSLINADVMEFNRLGKLIAKKASSDLQII